MLKVGILGEGFVQWGGGLDFLRTIVTSLCATSQPLELHFLAPGTGPRASLQRADQRLRGVAKKLLGRPTAPSYAPSRADIRRAIASFDVPVEVHDIDIGPAALRRQARHLGLDVLLPSFTPLPFDTELPWLGYVYDFQHRHLPHFFSERDRAKRDQDFATMLGSARAVIVNARAVARDIATFHPGSRARVFALPFSTAPSSSWLPADEDVTGRYGITGRYFIVCNQFWQHKDHATAFAAFARIAHDAGNGDLHLVCTGATSDYRSAGHFDTLMATVRAAGIEARVHALGLIPKRDQVALLKGAMALVQPTLSEGGPGGGAVYDAVAVGVPSIVSDIPVNLEIDNEPLVSFFKAQDPESLAAALQARAEAPAQPRSTAQELVAQGQARRARCGKVLLEAIDFVRPRSRA